MLPLLMLTSLCLIRSYQIQQQAQLQAQAQVPRQSPQVKEQQPLFQQQQVQSPTAAGTPKAAAHLLTASAHHSLRVCLQQGLGLILLLPLACWCPFLQLAVGREPWAVVTGCGPLLQLLRLRLPAAASTAVLQLHICSSQAFRKLVSVRSCL